MPTTSVNDTIVFMHGVQKTGKHGRAWLYRRPARSTASSMDSVPTVSQNPSSYEKISESTVSPSENRSTGQPTCLSMLNQRLQSED